METHEFNYITNMKKESRLKQGEIFNLKFWVHEHAIKKKVVEIIHKESKPKSRTLGFAKIQDHNQNLGWDCTKGK